MTTITGRELIERGPDVGLFEQIDEDVFECRLCQSTDVDVEVTPSMYAGDDHSQHCRSCRAYTSTDPFTGVTSIYRRSAPGPRPAITDEHGAEVPQDVADEVRLFRRVAFGTLSDTDAAEHIAAEYGLTAPTIRALLTAS